MTVFQKAIYGKFRDFFHSLHECAALHIKNLQSSIAHHWDFMLYIHLFSHGQSPTALFSVRLLKMAVQILLG